MKYQHCSLKPGRQDLALGAGVQLIRALQNGTRQSHLPQPTQLASRSAFQGNGRVVRRGAERPVGVPRDSAWTQVRWV